MAAACESNDAHSGIESRHGDRAADRLHFQFRQGSAEVSFADQSFNSRARDPSLGASAGTRWRIRHGPVLGHAGHTRGDKDRLDQARGDRNLSARAMADLSNAHRATKTNLLSRR